MEEVESSSLFASTERPVAGSPHGRLLVFGPSVGLSIGLSIGPSIDQSYGPLRDDRTLR